MVIRLALSCNSPTWLDVLYGSRVRGWFRGSSRVLSGGVLSLSRGVRKTSPIAHILLDKSVCGGKSVEIVLDTGRPL